MSSDESDVSDAALSDENEAPQRFDPPERVQAKLKPTPAAGDDIARSIAAWPSPVDN